MLTVSVAGSVLTSVAGGRVRVETELAATHTSTIANMATDTLLEKANSVKDAEQRPGDAVDGSSAATKVVVQRSALNLALWACLKRRHISTTREWALITSAAQTAAASGCTHRLEITARMTMTEPMASDPETREPAYSSSSSKSKRGAGARTRRQPLARFRDDRLLSIAARLASHERADVGVIAHLCEGHGALLGY